MFELIEVYCMWHKSSKNQSDYSVKGVQVFGNVNTFKLIILILNITGLITKKLLKVHTQIHNSVINNSLCHFKHKTGEKAP